jgi:REP element-mobilizing transposase RayT
MYHIYDRGNNREKLFIEERNYGYFLNLYHKHIDPVANTYAYCLMSNHFHLLAKIKENKSSELDPTQHFSNLFNAYAKSINKAYGRTGALFQRPFRRIEVTDIDYCRKLVCYIHLNPEKHGFAKDARSYCHSSYSELTSADTTWLARDEVIAWFGGSDRFVEAHQAASEELGFADFVGED